MEMKTPSFKDARPAMCQTCKKNVIVDEKILTKAKMIGFCPHCDMKRAMEWAALNAEFIQSIQEQFQQKLGSQNFGNGR